MKDSAQKFLRRSPRQPTQPAYLRLPGAGSGDGDLFDQGRELPFIIDVLGEFSGDPAEPAPPLAERRFIAIDQDTLDAVMQRLNVGLSLGVAHSSTDGGPAAPVNLRFTCLDDFRPERIAAQLAPLSGSELSRQLRIILHHEKFRRLEASWRGLCYLLKHSDTNERLQIRICSVSKRELYEDLAPTVAVDGTADTSSSWLHGRLYTDGYAMGGTPCGALIGDYQFSAHADDITLLQGIAQVAASAFTPFLSAASSEFFGFRDWREMDNVRDLASLLEDTRYARWQAFRDSEIARFVALSLPRVLARPPHGTAATPLPGVDFIEVPPRLEADPTQYCWMNAAYTLGVCLARSFQQHGWCVAIQGMEGGGLVEGLPLYEAELVDDVGPTEILINERRLHELSTLGFLPLCSIRHQNRAVFFSATTVQHPAKYADPDITARAATGAMLWAVMAGSRVAQYINFMFLNDFIETIDREAIETQLNVWLGTHLNADADLDAQQSAHAPLQDARFMVEEQDTAGVYRARLSVQLRLPSAALVGPIEMTMALQAPRG